MNKYLFSLLILLLAQLGFGQCYEDRHNTSSASNWRSCEKSASPNPARGDSYWINYDFDEIKSIKELHFWNINQPDLLSEGARQIAVDYSLDGINWSFWGIWEVGQGSGSGFYEGETGPDLGELVTRHLLLTIIDNYGGDCSGFGEIRIGLDANFVNTGDLADSDNRLELFPNPAENYTNLRMKSSATGPATAELLDINGRVVHSEKLILTGEEQEMRFPLETAASGPYIIRVVSSDSEFSTELTITKTK